MTKTMHISRLHIKGFKRFVNFQMNLKAGLNILVGDNETGKTSIIEAITLLLTKQYEGRLIDSQIDPFLFNVADVAAYFDAMRNGRQASPPRIYMEAHFSGDKSDPVYANLQGTNNIDSVDCAGVSLTIELNKDHTEEFKAYAADENNPCIIPTEYYRVSWLSFANKTLTSRSLCYKAKVIDTGGSRYSRGTNRYLHRLADEALNEPLRRELSLSYKRLRHSFAQEQGVCAINKHLGEKGAAATDKKLTMQIDMSARAAWESSITPHLDDLPFECAGKGEQSRVQVCLAVVDSGDSQTLLIEEPENHLSHSNLNRLIDEVFRSSSGRQVLVTTHSAFVLNKLGLDRLILLSRTQTTTTIDALSPDTQDYFMKLPGFDTLRLILSRKCFLVEGPSDELILQAAYRMKYGKLPSEDGLDVISVRGLSAKRFLEIAALLKHEVRVVADNDGDVEAIKTKYKDYLGRESISLFYDVDESSATLEPQMIKANSLAAMNGILGTSYATANELQHYMTSNKTDCALTMFKTTLPWTAPEYIRRAIDAK